MEAIGALIGGLIGLILVIVFVVIILGLTAGVVFTFLPLFLGALAAQLVGGGEAGDTFMTIGFVVQALWFAVLKVME